MLLGFIDDTIRPSPGAEAAVSEHSVTNRAIVFTFKANA